MATGVGACKPPGSIGRDVAEVYHPDPAGLIGGRRARRMVDLGMLPGGTTSLGLGMDVFGPVLGWGENGSAERAVPGAPRQMTGPPRNKRPGVM